MHRKEVSEMFNVARMRECSFTGPPLGSKFTYTTNATFTPEKVSAVDVT